MPVANRIPEPNLRRLLVGLDVEGESLRLATERDHLVHRRYRRLLCRHRPTRWIRAEDKVVGERHTPSRSCDGGLNMQVTEVRIRRTKKASVKAHAIICFDNCFLVRELKVIQGPAGLSVSFPAKQLSDGTHWDIVFPCMLRRER